MDKLFSWANVHKSRFTSLVGAIIIIASVVSVFSHNRSWSEAAAGITIGMVLLGMKDPTGGAGVTGVVGGFVLLSMLTFGGCVSSKKVLAKYGTQNAPVTVAVTDTVKVPITVSTKADSLSTSLSLDSLADANFGDTLKLVSAGGTATVKFWKSPVTKLGGSQRLNARFDVPPQVIHDTVTKVLTVYGKCPPTYTLAPKPGRFARYWHRYEEFCTALLSIGLVVALLLLGFRAGLFKFLRFLPFLGVVMLLGSAVGCRTQHIERSKFRPAPLPKQIYRNLHRI